jgi:uncharacterized protein with PIN domain
MVIDTSALVAVLLGEANAADIAARSLEPNKKDVTGAP